MNKITLFNKKQIKKLPEIRPGYTVQVNSKIKEGDKERIQAFEGLVIAKKHGSGLNATITVRKISHQVGVERIFPIHSPVIESIQVIKKGKVRRAKLYYIRRKSAKESRLKAKTVKQTAGDKSQTEVSAASAAKSEINSDKKEKTITKKMETPKAE